MKVLAYVIAAYVIVVGSLAGYGLWIRAQRRALIAEGSREETAEKDDRRGE